MPPTAPTTASTCGICEEPLHCRWTDTHGVGACRKCGAPHRLYHYEGEGNAKRPVDKASELLTLPAFVPLLRRYHQETGRNCSPGAFNLPGSSYEVAVDEDFETLDRFVELHRSEFDAAAAA